MKFVVLTDNREHPGGLAGLCVTFIFSLVVKHRLVDDEDVLATLSNNLVLFTLSDFTSVLEPADLRAGQEEDASEMGSCDSPASCGRTDGAAHLDVPSGDFTFKPGGFLLSDLDIVEWLRELNLWSCQHKQRVVNNRTLVRLCLDKTPLRDTNQTSLNFY